MEVVKNKDEAGLNALYCSPKVNLYVTRKYQNKGQLLFAATSSGWAAGVGTLQHPYELKISELKVEPKGERMAVSWARFDEFDDHVHGQDGYDLFTYFLTEEGYKISHMNVSIAWDSDDLPEKVEMTMDEENLNRLVSSIQSDFLKGEKGKMNLIHPNWKAWVGTYSDYKFTGIRSLDYSGFIEMIEGLGFHHKLEIGSPSVVDGFLAFSEGTFLNQKKEKIHAIFTFINFNNDWYLTSVQCEYLQ